MAGHQRPASGIQASREDGARKGLCWASPLCLCGLLCLPVAVGFPFLLLSHLAKPASCAPEGLRHTGDLERSSCNAAVPCHSPTTCRLCPQLRMCPTLIPGPQTSSLSYLFTSHTQTAGPSARTHSLHPTSASPRWEPAPVPFPGYEDEGLQFNKRQNLNKMTLEGITLSDATGPGGASPGTRLQLL